MESIELLKRQYRDARQAVRSVLDRINTTEAIYEAETKRLEQELLEARLREQEWKRTIDKLEGLK